MVAPLQVEEKLLPRLCRLTRESHVDQYGFDFKTLKNEGKHIANNVRENYPADIAGLKDGDFILEVNGESIDGMEHDAVVNKISAHHTKVDLLVVNDLNAYLDFNKHMKEPEVNIPIDGIINKIKTFWLICKNDY